MLEYGTIIWLGTLTWDKKLMVISLHVSMVRLKTPFVFIVCFGKKVAIIGMMRPSVLTSITARGYIVVTGLPPDVSRN